MAGLIGDETIGKIPRRSPKETHRRETSVPPAIRRSPSQADRALATLRLLFNYAERCGYQVTNPVKGFEFYVELRRMRALSLEEEIAYFAAASQPLKDIARIILDTGMRPDEIFRIEFANADFERRSIFNAFGKTPAARRNLTMTDEVFSILKKNAPLPPSRGTLSPHPILQISQ